MRPRAGRSLTIWYVFKNHHKILTMHQDLAGYCSWSRSQYYTSLFYKKLIRGKPYKRGLYRIYWFQQLLYCLVRAHRHNNPINSGRDALITRRNRCEMSRAFHPSSPASAHHRRKEKKRDWDKGKIGKKKEEEGTVTRLAFSLMKSIYRPIYTDDGRTTQEGWEKKR